MNTTPHPRKSAFSKFSKPYSDDHLLRAVAQQPPARCAPAVTGSPGLFSPYGDISSTTESNAMIKSLVQAAGTDERDAGFTSCFVEPCSWQAQAAVSEPAPGRAAALPALDLSRCRFPALQGSYKST